MLMVCEPIAQKKVEGGGRRGTDIRVLRQMGICPWDTNSHAA
jgi:hypothetical protein